MNIMQKLQGEVNMIENIEDFKEVLNKLPSLSIVEEKDDKIILNYERFGKQWELEKDDVEDIIKKLKEKNIKKDETILYNEYSYEVLIKFESSPLIFLRDFYDDRCISKEDIANSIEYELSKPTNEYMLFIFKALGESGSLRDFFRHIPSPIMRKKIKDLDFFEFLSEIIGNRIYTLKIKSKEPVSVDKFSDLATSFLFNLSYNLNMAIIEIRFLCELNRYRFVRKRRSSLDEIEPPRRIYIPDLTYRYQMAISTDSIPLQFLSFYHIIEYFFHDVYNEELLNTIKDKITSPDFSYKRKKDLESLVKLIRQKNKREDLSYINEQEALYLTLKKYIELDDLIEKLNEYDNRLIEYYKKEKVPFSQGRIVDFTLDTEKVFKQLADRIYKTRNSIVHSKEAGKPKYVPFRNDRELLMEIPLMRFISEEIIINSSKIIH
jgi:hypothetical protein